MRTSKLFPGGFVCAAVFGGLPNLTAQNGGGKSSTPEPNTGGVNVIVGDSGVESKITIIERGNDAGYHVHSLPNVVSDLYSMSVSAVEVKLQTGGRVPVALQMRPVLTAWYRNADGTRTTVKTVEGDFVLINNSQKGVQTVPIDFQVEAGLGPKLNVDVEFHFKGQVKDVSVDENSLKIVSDSISKDAPVFVGQLSGIPDVYPVPDDETSPVTFKFDDATAQLARQ